MRIIINGKEETIVSSTNLRNLIEQFCKDQRHVIAELNGAIVRNPEWDKYNLKDGEA